jgi:hypothetical protein
MKLLLKLLVGLLLLINLALVAILILRINVAPYPLSNLGEHIRTYDLTRRYGDDLAKAIERYEGAFTLTGYVRRDELDQYATGRALLSLQEKWEAARQGEKIGVISPDSASIQVFSYTESIAKVLIVVRWESVIYEATGPKVVSERRRAALVRRDLQFEDGVWKVNELGDACGIDEQPCIDSLKSD